MKSIKPTIDKDKQIPNAKLTFLSHLNRMIRKNREFYNQLVETNYLKIPATMYRRDATKASNLDSSSVDLIITSPPYVTSYEYADLHQLSLLWFGDDKKNFRKWHKFSNEFNAFRKNFIGTSYKKQKIGFLSSTIAKNIVDELDNVERSLALDVANYFCDMNKVFTEMKRILKPKGVACIIVGNTELRGVKILNAEVAAEQMSKLGFRKLDFIKREVINKMITPWRDKNTGKFTNLKNPAKKRAYEFEYLIIMEK